jgi:uncharacterized membrane protein
MTAISAGQTAPRDGQLANWKTGLALGGIAGIASLGPSLLPRSGSQQAIVTAASIALGYGAGVASNAIANKLDSHTDLDAVGSRAVIAGVGALGVLGATLALRVKPGIAMQTLRTGAGVVGAGAIAGAALVGEQALVDRIKDHVPGGAAGAHAAIFGAAALGAGALVLGRVRSSAVSAEAESAYRASLLEGTISPPPPFDEAHFTELSKLRGRMTSVSGVRAGTLLPDTTVGTSGRRFLNEVTPPAEIARVMEVDPARVKEPIRVFGGVRHAATRDELAQLIFDESLAKGAFDRSHIVLYVPAGTGHINPMPVAASEYETLGDIASIGMQYGNKPSLQSIPKLDDATDLFQRVMERFRNHIDTLPEAQRPTLTAYGESLGAWAAQDAFIDGGAAAVRESGLTQLVTVGTPGLSKMRTSTVGAFGHGLDASGAIFEFNDVAGLRALDPSTREGVRGYMLTHFNDPVNKFSPSWLVKRPEFLAHAEQAQGVPRKMKWVPGVTGVQGIFDTSNGITASAGALSRSGHDYRADMAPAMAEILRTGTTEQQLARIADSLAQIELARVHMPKPMPHLSDVATQVAGAAT